MYKVLAILLWINHAFGGEIYRDSQPPHVSPEFLDQLRRENRYEEFAYYIGAKNVEEVIPTKGNFSQAESLEKGYCTVGEDFEESARQGANFSYGKPKPWLKPEGVDYYVVPYAVANAEFNDREEHKIWEILDHWNRNVRFIQFRKHRGKEADYVYIYNGKGCSASLGRRGGQQGLSLSADNNCVQQIVILHEQMHTVGMGHEHARIDRDEYIEVLWENINEAGKSAYSKQTVGEFVILADYDYETFMHYFSTAFTFGSLPGFKVKKEGVSVDEVGKSYDLTALDYRKLRKLYNVEL